VEHKVSLATVTIEHLVKFLARTLHPHSSACESIANLAHMAPYSSGCCGWLIQSFTASLSIGVT
jgi:hypothetical protein